MPSRDPDFRLALMRLARLNRQQRAEGDVAEGQRSALFFLYDEGAKSLGALSEHDKVTPPSMNRTVNHLLERGYVTRVTDETDARKVSIDLTDLGRDFVEETRRRRDRWFEDRLGKLTPEERAALDAAVPVIRKLSTL